MRRQRGGDPWLSEVIARKKPKVAAVALANKTARIAWALMARNQSYLRTRPASTATR